MIFNLVLAERVAREVGPIEPPDPPPPPEIAEGPFLSAGSEGALGRDAIVRVIDAAMPELRGCPDERQRSEWIHLTVALLIRRDGTVQRARAHHYRREDLALRACVEERAARWTFPPAESATQYTGRIPFELDAP